MNKHSRGALLIDLACKISGSGEICYDLNTANQSETINDDYFEKNSTAVGSEYGLNTSIDTNLKQNVITARPCIPDGGADLTAQISDKENIFYEDSDHSVRDPNFESECILSSSSSSGCPKSIKRFRCTHSLTKNLKQQKQTEPSDIMTEDSILTMPSTSKITAHRTLSTSSDSPSLSSGSTSSSSYSVSSSSVVNASVPLSACLPYQETHTIETNASDIENRTVKKPKKRLARVDEWLSNKAKMQRNTGKPYISRSKSKKTIPAKCLRPPCSEKCKLQCAKKIPDITRAKIFENYWELGDIELQRNFIHKNIKPIVPAIRFSGKEQPRKCNHSFYFQVDGQVVRVCKSFFRATLDINDRVIRTVIEKSEDGFLKHDMRGRHLNHKKVAESIRQDIRNHINLIPRIESHYVTKTSSREYIDGGKSLRDLYRDYKSLCESNNAPFGNETLYSRIFNGEFNISFFTPKKDRCELCVRYENAQDNVRKNLEAEYLRHIEEKQLSRAEKEIDKKNAGPNNIVAVYDLQAVLQLPRGNNSIFYYKSKLNNFNLTVSHINNNDTDSFFWHEGKANCGADEIGSCMFKFIENQMRNYNGPGLDITFYSDNCCGQNKNRFIVSIYMFALIKFQKIKSITHKYLITGHTKNEGDSVHSTIEKQIQKRLNSGPIYVPTQYVEVIKCAKKKGRPYVVTEMSSDDFYSLKRLSEDIGFSTSKVFKMTEVKVFKLMQGDPTKLLFKTSYKDDEFSETILTRKKNLAQITLKLAYRSKPKLKENKIQDLLELVRNNHIPHIYESFYKSLK